MKFKEYFPFSIVVFCVVVILIMLDLVGWSNFAWPVFLLICFGLVFFSFKKPEWMFWLFVGLLPLEKILITPKNFPISLRPYQLVGAILSLVLILAWLFKKSQVKLLGFQKICLVCKFLKSKSCNIEKSSFNFLDRLIFVLPVFAFLGSFAAPSKSIALKGALILFSFVLLVWLARNFFQTNRQKLEALWFFSLGSAPVVLFGMYQALAFKFGWPSFEVFEGRINGTFTEPDWFGMFLAFLFAIELWCLLLMNLSRNTTKIGNFRLVSLGKFVAHLDLFLISALLFLTVSRSAWLAAAVVGAAFVLSSFWFSEKAMQAWKNVLSVIIAGGLALLFVIWSGLFTFHFVNRAASSVTGMQKITISCVDEISDVPQRIENISALADYGCKHINLEEIASEKQKGSFVSEVYRPDPNINIRKSIYAKTWQVIKQHPLFGIGVGSSAIVLGLDEHGSGYNASNIFLEIWISMGVLALLSFVFVLGYLPVKLVKNILANPQSKNRMRFGSFALVSFGAVVVPNFFNAGFLVGFLWVWLALLISLLDDNEE